MRRSPQHVHGLLFGLAVFLLAPCALPAAAQEDDSAAGPEGVGAEVLQTIAVAEQKFIGLAEALSEEQYAWRPGEGVRSVSEVFMHIAGNNYWLPILLGYPAPDGVPITRDYQSAWDYEKNTGRAEVRAALQASFTHLKETLAQVPPDRLDEPMDIFGTPGTVRAYLLVITTHMHEHLGQAIAYARMNGVKPPWSN
ncbi:MAG: DinB family protein [Rhodothermales bacterium]